MGLERRLLRQQQKKHADNGSIHGQLQKAIGDLQGVRDLGQAARQVQDLVGELTALREELRRALASVPVYQAQLDRQRAVFLRLMAHPDAHHILALEQQFQAEYDAMQVLVGLLSWVKEAP
jgi:hypothetical protein